MNKKKGLIIGGTVLGVVVIIALVIILVIANGDDNGKNNVKETGSLAESSISDLDLTQEATEEGTEKITEESTEEPTTEVTTEETTEEDTEGTTEEPTTEENKNPEPKGKPAEILEKSIIETEYDTYNDAYLYLLDVYDKVYGYGTLYSLVNYSIDLEPELLVDVDNKITLYTFYEGKLYKLIDKLEHTIFANSGYEYLPYAHAVRKVSWEYGGLIKNETYSYIWLDLTEEKKETYGTREAVYNLKQTFFDDVNKNGVPDNGEATGKEYVRYYIDGKEVFSLEDYNSAISQGEYIPFIGEDTAYHISAELQKPELQWVRDKKCREAYKEIIKQVEEKYPGTEISYSLIDCDGDETPELVYDLGCAVSLYTYKYGRTYLLMDEWGFGAMGNHGYEYLPGKNVYRNVNSNRAGGEYVTSFFKANNDYELEDMYSLIVVYDDPESEEPVHYKWTGETQVKITEEEYNNLMIYGSYYMIVGHYSREEVESYLGDKNPDRK